MQEPKREPLTEQDILSELMKIHKAGYPITSKCLAELRRWDIINDLRKLRLTLTHFQQQMNLPFKKVWTRTEIIQNYQRLYLELGIAPTATTLSNMGMGALTSAIKKHFGCMSKFRNEIEISVKRKPHNYWTYDNTIKELQQFFNTYQKEIQQASFSTVLNMYERHDLNAAVLKFGGLKEVSKTAGLSVKFKRDCWTEQEIFDDLKEIVKAGYQITQNSLKGLGRNDLLGAMHKQGISYFKQKLGLKIQRYNYWSESQILKELVPIVEEFKRIPSKTILKLINKGGLSRAMDKTGGRPKYCRLLNTVSSGYYIARDGHYLQSGYECIFDNILFKLGIPHQVHVKFSEEHNYLCDFLIEDIYIEIAGFDEKNHPEYFIRLNEKIKTYQNLSKKYIIIDKNFFRCNIQTIETKVIQRLATYRCIVGTAIDNTNISISTGTSSNIMELRAENNQLTNCKPEHPFPHRNSTALLLNQCSNSDIENNIRPVNYWSDLENIKKELLPLVAKYGRMPLDSEFRKERKLSLINGIYKYHESYFELGKKLGVKVRYKPKQHYSFKNTIAEYSELSTESGRYLTQNDLKRLGLHGLINNIAKYNGIFKIRAHCNLGFKQSAKPYGYYTLDKALAEYKALCIQKEDYLKRKELISSGLIMLAGFIQRNGGYAEFRTLTGLGLGKKTLRDSYNQENIVSSY